MNRAPPRGLSWMRISPWFVYKTYIKTTPKELWQALTDPAFTEGDEERTLERQLGATGHREANDGADDLREHLG